jgi:2,3-bisphosphoglycerate-dependent phosphoglycerate mutase
VGRQLTLVRHSLPEIDKDRPARAWRLSGEGKARARRLADVLKSHGFDFIATSNEPKAVETAQILAAPYRLKPLVIAGLHEHERSTAAPYLSQPDFEAVVRELFEKPDIPVFGNETANQAHERFSGAVHSILSDNKNSKIAIVTHGTVISLFVSRLTGKSGFQIWSQLGLPCFVVLDLQSKELIAHENIS